MLRAAGVGLSTTTPQLVLILSSLSKQHLPDDKVTLCTDCIRAGHLHHTYPRTKCFKMLHAASRLETCTEMSRHYEQLRCVLSLGFLSRLYLSTDKVTLPPGKLCAGHTHHTCPWTRCLQMQHAASRPETCTEVYTNVCPWPYCITVLYFRTCRLEL